MICTEIKTEFLGYEPYQFLCETSVEKSKVRLFWTLINPLVGMELPMGNKLISLFPSPQSVLLDVRKEVPLEYRSHLCLLNVQFVDKNEGERIGNFFWYHDYILKDMKSTRMILQKWMVWAYSGTILIAETYTPNLCADKREPSDPGIRKPINGWNYTLMTKVEEPSISRSNVFMRLIPYCCMIRANCSLSDEYRFTDYWVPSKQASSPVDLMNMTV